MLRSQRSRISACTFNTACNDIIFSLTLFQSVDTRVTNLHARHSISIMNLSIPVCRHNTAKQEKLFLTSFPVLPNPAFAPPLVQIEIEGGRWYWIWRILLFRLTWVFSKGARTYCRNLAFKSSTLSNGCVKESAHKIFDICTKKTHLHKLYCLRNYTFSIKKNAKNESQLINHAQKESQPDIRTYLLSTNITYCKIVRWR